MFIRASPFSLSYRDAETVHHTGGGGARSGRQRARSFSEQAGFYQRISLVTVTVGNRGCCITVFQGEMHEEWLLYVGDIGEELICLFLSSK